jgi:hypothetical protein
LVREAAVGAGFAGAIGGEVEDGDGVVHTELSLLRELVGLPERVGDPGPERAGGFGVGQ